MLSTNGVTATVIGKPIATVGKNILNHIWKKLGTIPIFTTVTVKDIRKDIIKPIINPNNAGGFYAINNSGIFSSTDSGVSWTALDIPWPKEYLLQHHFSLAVG